MAQEPVAYYLYKKRMFNDFIRDAKEKDEQDDGEGQKG